MARLYSRKKGKSGSKTFVELKKPSWQTHKPDEVELLVVKLAKQGLPPSQIGMELRDSYGIPDIKILCGKTVSQILAAKKLLKELPEDLMALIKKSIQITQHLENNKHDQPAKRGLLLTESKIRRLVKYYKGTGRLPQSWKFDPDKIRLLIE
ncbi:30S ribosomal protein S15 [Candidatus Woesearchaeota archaeon]|nr:30S ribosomal protein S15 [Candidatus Woesearchaeota archaeon]